VPQWRLSLELTGPFVLPYLAEARPRVRRAAGAGIRFITEAVGTPAPTVPAPLALGGMCRHVRNPMYLTMGLAVVAQALILGQPLLYP
jgi:hypothetical protein